MNHLPDPSIIEATQAVWGLALQPAGCLHCQTAHLVTARQIGAICPACGQGLLQSQPARLRPEAPEALIPFRKTPAALRANLEAFMKPVWLRANDCSAETLARRATPVFWPMWLVDCDIQGEWQAEMGFDYQVKSSHETYASSGWHTREVVETRTRWEPRLGQIKRRFQNIPVHATDEHNAIVAFIGGYRQAEAIPYAAAQIGTAVIRIPDNPPQEIWNLAQNEIERAAADECCAAAEAQHVRRCGFHTEYPNPHWTQLLQPLYVTYYTHDDGRRQMVYVNGQTGQVGGALLASQRKGWMWAGVSLAAAILALILGGVFAAASTIAPPLVFLSFLAILGGLAALVFTAICAIWPWQWNKKQAARSLFYKSNG